jgi:hypothetical protein
MPSRLLGAAVLLAFALANAGSSICAAVHHSGTAHAHGSHHAQHAGGPAVGPVAPAHGCTNPMHCGISVIAVRADVIRPTAIVATAFTPISAPTVFAPTPPLSLSTPPPRA